MAGRPRGSRPVQPPRLRRPRNGKSARVLVEFGDGSSAAPANHHVLLSRRADRTKPGKLSHRYVRRSLQGDGVGFANCGPGRVTTVNIDVVVASGATIRGWHLEDGPAWRSEFFEDLEEDNTQVV